MNPHCCICGRFCRWDTDYSVPFGTYGDIDPPDAEFYCPSCIKEQKTKHTEWGWLPVNWIPAKWEYEVAEAIGFIRIYLPSAAWGRWHNTNQPIPKGYITVDEVLDEEYISPKEIAL